MLRGLGVVLTEPNRTDSDERPVSFVRAKRDETMFSIVYYLSFAAFYNGPIAQPVRAPDS